MKGITDPAWTSKRKIPSGTIVHPYTDLLFDRAQDFRRRLNKVGSRMADGFAFITAEMIFDIPRAQALVNEFTDLLQGDPLRDILTVRADAYLPRARDRRRLWRDAVLKRRAAAWF